MEEPGDTEDGAGSQEADGSVGLTDQAWSVRPPAGEGGQ